jgi:hypothetical protein
MTSSTPSFDLANPAHKTIAEWATAGNNSWFVNAVAYCLAHGEARILLRAGNVLRLSFVPPGPIGVEEVSGEAEAS